jgi:hypothetical protein
MGHSLAVGIAFGIGIAVGTAPVCNRAPTFRELITGTFIAGILTALAEVLVK